MAERANPSKILARQAEQSRGLPARGQKHGTPFAAAPGHRPVDRSRGKPCERGGLLPVFCSDAGRSPKSVPARERGSGKSLLRSDVPPHAL